MSFIKKLKNNYHLVLFTLVISFYAFFYISVSMHIPVDGDGALHAATVEDMRTTGIIGNNHPYTITDGDELLPIFYPKLFYTEMTAIATLMGELTYQLIVPIFGIISSILVYLIVLQLLNSKSTALISMIVALSSFGLSTNSVNMFRMETTVMLLSLASIYSLLKFAHTNLKAWLFCSSIILAANISTKQNIYIIFPLYLLAFFLENKSTIMQKLKMFSIYLVISFALACPFLINEFLSTGTLFYPGVPLVGKFEKVVANTLDIKLYSVGEGWVKYGIGSDRILHLKNQYSELSSHIEFLNPFSYISTKYFTNFIIALFLLGVIVLIVKKHYFFVIFLFFEQLILIIQPLDRYFLLNQIISAMIVGVSSYAFILLVKMKRRSLQLIISALILSLSAISITNILSRSVDSVNYSWGSYVPNRIKSEALAGNWMKLNTPEDSVIITPRTHVFSYYSHRKALWVNQLGGKDIYEAFIQNDIDKIYSLSKNYKDSYLILPKYWVTNGDADGKWVSYVEARTVSMIDEKSDYFQKVYSTDQIDIYKVQ